MRQIEVSDLVQKQRPAMGDFKQTRLGRIGAAEGSLLVAEQLAFEKIFRQRRAVDVDPGARASRRIVMNGARHHFLAGAAFSGDQRGRVRGRNLAHLGKQLAHRIAGEDGSGADKLMDLGNGRRLVYIPIVLKSLHKVHTAFLRIAISNLRSSSSLLITFRTSPIETICGSSPNSWREC